MNKKKVYIVIGPPLSGKSTYIEKVLHIKKNNVFSVRMYFKELETKKEIKLPRAGTFLPNDKVVDEFKKWFFQKKHSFPVVLDGVPGNEDQAMAIKKILEGFDIEYFWIDISKNEAFERMKQRKVCFSCDGGINQAQVTADLKFCALCGSRLGKREDDNFWGFNQRWEGFIQRKPGLLNAINVKVDMHMHSDASDGIYNIKKLVQEAYKKDIKVMSVTDHDSVQNVEAAIRYAKKYGILCIPGIEISTIWNKRVFHILAYGINISDKKIKKLEEKQKINVQNRDLEVIEKIAVSKETMDDYKSYTYCKERGGWKLLNYLQDRHYILSGQEYELWVDKGIIPNVRYINIEEAIETIHESGGYAILAHPGAYEGIHYQYLIDSMGSIGIDGIEIFHPYNSFGLQEYGIHWANENKKMITGGSDFHGNLSDRILGLPEIRMSQIQIKEILVNT